jgi:hypothetical protein
VQKIRKENPIRGTSSDSENNRRGEDRQIPRKKFLYRPSLNISYHSLRRRSECRFILDIENAGLPCTFLDL